MTRLLGSILLVLHLVAEGKGEYAKDHQIFMNSRRVQPLEHLPSTSTIKATHSPQIIQKNAPTQEKYLRGRDESESMSILNDLGQNTQSYLTAIQSMGNSITQALLKSTSSGIIIAIHPV